MPTFAIGDIHGCLTALQTLAATVPFKAKDKLIVLGDYVDKGPDTAGVLDWLCDRWAGGNLVALLGNHDLLMLEARESAANFDVWMDCNGHTTLASYDLPLRRASLDKIPKKHWKFLESTELYYENKTHFYVHGNVDPDLPLKKQPEYLLLWEKFYDPSPHMSGKTMVCGHTSQKDGHIDDIGHAVCIDTYACGGQWLTALDPETGKLWQANQDGQTQTAKR
ncbi:MAG: metallophosphoesterase family protein [Planctomycetota bacterium]